MASYSFNELSVGMITKRCYHFTEQRVESFSNLVDDKAPVHMDEEYAKSHGFKGRIVHGLFVQSIISGMLGTELPGPQSVINTLSMKMHGPVAIGETVAYQVEIASLTPSVSAVTLNFSGMIGIDRLIISGKALCSFPRASG